MTPALYAALTHCGTRGESCIAALPLVRPPPPPPNAPVVPLELRATPINLNTAPLRVLQALPGANLARVQQFDAARQRDPKAALLENAGDAAATSPKGFLDPVQPPPNIPPNQKYAPLPKEVRSSWFRLESISAIGGTQVALYSTLFRPQGGTPGVYYRSSAPG